MVGSTRFRFRFRSTNEGIEIRIKRLHLCEFLDCACDGDFTTAPCAGTSPWLLAIAELIRSREDLEVSICCQFKTHELEMGSSVLIVGLTEVKKLRKLRSKIASCMTTHMAVHNWITCYKLLIIVVDDCCSGWIKQNLKSIHGG